MKIATLCPVCFSSDIKKYLQASHQHGKNVIRAKEKFTYYHCNNCNVVFLTGIPIDKSYYQTYYTFPEDIKKSKMINSLEKRLTTLTNNKKQTLIQKFIGNKKRKIDLLDIGSGTGNFLASLDSTKYNAIGIELDRKEYLISKQKNLTVYCSDILKQNFAGKQFDVITMWHVVEHIPDPHKLLKKINTILKKDGVLIMSTPNIDAFGFKFAKEKWFHLDAPRHLILYGRKGIKELSIQNGFRIKKTLSQTFEFPLDLFWSIKHLNLKYFIYPVYPLMKYISKETQTYVLLNSNEK